MLILRICEYDFCSVFNGTCVTKNAQLTSEKGLFLAQGHIGELNLTLLKTKEPILFQFLGK